MQGSKLYVGNFAYSVTDLQLKELFANYGEVKDVTLIPGKGFGFVEMSNPQEAEKAKVALNGTQWEGRTIKVDEARPQSARKERSRPYYGGGGGGFGGGEKKRYGSGRGRRDRTSRGRGYGR